MQQFILEEHLDIIVSESGGEIDEVMHLEREEFIGITLRRHQANSRRKWRLTVENEKKKKRKKEKKKKIQSHFIDFCTIC